MNSQDDNLQPPFPWWLRVLNSLILAIAIGSLMYMLALDAGKSHSTSGAGEIWWASTPEVIQSYQDLSTKWKEH